jgi:hypothetical protein
MTTKAAGLRAAFVCALFWLATPALAVTYELRGTGTLPSFGGAPPAGVVGESITVSVMLDSDDFDYLTVANPVFHYFVPNTNIPVHLTGSITGAYPNVSPISRFLALELTGSGSSKDFLALDVESDSSGTTMFSVSANDGDGFDGNVTPFTSAELFTLFAQAMANQAEWTRSTNTSVYVGNDLLYLGSLNWSLLDPDEPPTQQGNIHPTFDVQLKPGNAYPLGNASATTLDIDGGSGTSFPVLDVLMDFPLAGIPLNANITSAKLMLDATLSSTMTIHALGYAGDGLASLTDETASTSLIGSKNSSFTSTGDILIDLNADYVESLLGDASHLGLRLKSATVGPYIRIATNETLTGVRPTLVLEYSSGLSGDLNADGVVDGNDFLAWQRGGSPSPNSPTDLAAWKSAFAATASASTAAVPEPTTTGLALLACLAATRRRVVELS